MTRIAAVGLARGALRWLSLTALAVWLGGFTFYAGVVIPLLHDEFDPIQVAPVTRQATDTLNLIGAVALALCWLDWGLNPARSGRGHRREGLLLALDVALLLGLVAVHRVLDQKLDASSFSGFYPWHRLYLQLSTAQWFVNLALLAVRSPGLVPAPRAD